MRKSIVDTLSPLVPSSHFSWVRRAEQKWMTETMRVLIVGDDQPTRTVLANILSARTDVEHFDSADDAMEALPKLATNSYDVLLLDVDTPDISGIELLDQLRERRQPVPSVVFVTAHREHAIAAFENHAVDYVLKPFSNERIGEALDGALRRSAQERSAKLAQILPQLQKLAQGRRTRIAIKAKGRILFIDPAGVVAVHAERNYVLLQRETGSYLLRESISVLEEKLKPYGFIRIHRSVLVNTSFVEEIRPRQTGDYGLRVSGGKEYTVTRIYKKNLKSLAEFWIGMDTFIAD